MDDYKIIFNKDLEEDRKFGLFKLYYGITLPDENTEIDDIKLNYIKQSLLQPYRYLITHSSNIKLFSKNPDDERLFDVKLNISNIKKQNPLWKYSFKKEYLDPILNPEKIILYNAISETYFSFILETLTVMPLLNKNKPSTIGLYGISNVFFEPIMYYLRGNIKNKFEFDWFENNILYQFMGNETKSKLKGKYNKYDMAFQRLVSDKKNISFKTALEVNENDLIFKTEDEKRKFENKYDFLFLELSFINRVEILKYSIELTVPYIIYTTLQFLPTLKSKANMMLTPISATPLFIDFLAILEMAFERVEFYNPKTRIPTDPYFSNFVCCFGYENEFEKTDIYKKVMVEMSKLDVANEYLYKLTFLKNNELNKVELVKDQPTLKNNLFKNQPNKLKQYRNSPKQPNYLHRIFGKIPADKLPIYQKFYDYQKIIFSDYTLYEENAEKLYKNIKEKDINKFINRAKQEIIIDNLSSLSNSIEMAEFLGLKLKPHYKEIKNKNLHKVILEGFFNETPHFFKQKVENTKLLKKNSTDNGQLVGEVLMEVNAIYDVADMILNRVDIEEWDKVRDRVHYYRRQLLSQLEFERKTVNITQGGIKMWELLMNFDLIPAGKKEIKTFHICELPGSFIFATDLFIKTQRPEVKDWLFLAQSLWISNKSKFDDDFNLVRDYPDVYDFGPKKTGDITDIDNILYYSQRLKGKGLDMITSDCGVSPNDPNPKITILFASLLVILFCCSKGTSFVQKLYPPITEAHFNLFLLCAEWFDEFYIAKPSVNKQQTEFYIVGLGFKQNEMPKKEKDRLINHYKKDPEATKLKINASDEVIKSLGDALQMAATQFADEQEKTAEIVNFWHLFTKEEKEKIGEFGKVKRHEWIVNNKFPEIPKDGTFLLETS